VLGVQIGFGPFVNLAPQLEFCGSAKYYFYVTISVDVRVFYVEDLPMIDQDFFKNLGRISCYLSGARKLRALTRR
jgi:hypothetical protein